MDKVDKNIVRINIIQWNAQSLRPKMISFTELLNKEKIHIAILSETWLDNEVELNVSGYNIYRKDRYDSYGGVAIFVHKSIRSHLNFFQVLNSGIEVVSAKLINCKDLENVVALYCPSSVVTQPSDWDQIFSHFSNKTLIAGDFNGHHSNWSIKTDSRGTQIMDSSLENGLISLNNCSPTRIKLVNGILQKTSPDISFATSDIAIKFDWKVLNENLGSDHLIIKLTITIPDDFTINRKRNYKKANWKEYTDFLSKSFAVQCDDSDVQEMYDFFIDQINLAADKYIPYIKYSSKPTKEFKPKNYWTPELSHIVAQRRLFLAKFRRNPTPDNLSKLEEKIKEFHEASQKARSLGWQRFCDSIDHVVSVYDMWRRMRWIKGYKQSSNYPPIDKQNELLRSLTPDYVTNKTPIFVSKNETLECDFSIQELQNCLKKKDSAPGEDGISYSMISNLPNSARVRLLYIYNKIFSTGIVPIQWRNIQIIPIPKANNTATDPKLRPISLISCLCKIFHLMLVRRLEWYTERGKILSPLNIGFRKSLSCLDSLSRLVTYIQNGFSKNIPTVACFLDIENAYNNVSVDAVVKILDELQIGSKFCTYIWSFLNERHLKIRTEYSDLITDRWSNKGLAQGDPLSPLLFNLITFKICQQHLNTVVVSQYADDFVIYVKDRDIMKCERYIQNALDHIVMSLAELGLELSPNKSTYCVFSRGRRRILPSLKVNEQSITCSPCIKYLGMWLDQSLRWSKHVNEIIAKSSKFLNILKLLTGSSWGIHTKHIRKLFISLIRSRLDYGSFLYDCSAKTHLLKLDKLQNQALRIIGGYIKSSPIHVMESDLCVPPLFVRRKYLAYKYCLKSRSWSNNVTIGLISELSDYCLSSYWQNKKKPLLVEVYNDVRHLEITASEYLKMFSLEIWTSYIQKNIKNELKSLNTSKRNYNPNVLLSDIVAELNTIYFGWHKIYTDASKCAQGQGAGLFDQTLGNKFGYKINCDISIMSLELIAIYKATNYILNQNLNKVVIFSDSKSALQHIARCASGYSRGASIAYDILKLLVILKNNNIECRLQWVPAHIGLRGNEEADRISKSAVIDGCLINYVPDYWEYTAKFKSVCFNSWKEHFLKISLDKGIWYKSIQGQPSRVPWFENTKLDRNYVKLILRLRSGHYPSAKFAFLMKKADSPNCTVCNQIEDVQHLLMECARNRVERELFMNDCEINKFDVGIIQAILSTPSSEIIKKLCHLIIVLHE